jgi:hypothetical protein
MKTFKEYLSEADNAVQARGRYVYQRPQSQQANSVDRMKAAKDYAGGNREYGEFSNDAILGEPASYGSGDASRAARRDPKNTNLRYSGYNQGREGDRPLTQKVGPAKQAQASSGGDNGGGAAPTAKAQRTSSAPRASSGGTGGTPMSTSAYASQRAGITSKNLGGASSVIAGRRALAQKALNTTGGGAKGNMMRQRAERDLNGPTSGGR